MAHTRYSIADSPGRGVLIGILAALGSVVLGIALLALFFFLKYTVNGRILLDRLGRPGEYDDEQAFLQEEERALETMDDIQRSEYLRAKAFVQANPPETMQTDISLSQFLAIQEKGVSAWEFEPEMEIANCFVEGRTEIEFFDMVCCVQSNLPMPKQNDVYYWEAKIFEKPETTLISVGVTTKPYPLFRLPGYHRTSLAYFSDGQRRYNQPFSSTSYGHKYSQGDVVGVGYRPRSGTLFFTHNGKRLEDVAHGLKSQNFFPTIGATGTCSVHVNFGQMGFVFIEANVKKWGLAPMTGSLAPPPPYGSEAGSILLESGADKQTATRWAEWQEAVTRSGQQARNTANVSSSNFNTSHSDTQSGASDGDVRITTQPPPGPVRSPTDISLAPLARISQEEQDVGEGSSGVNAHGGSRDRPRDFTPVEDMSSSEHIINISGLQDQARSPPPDYSSPTPGSPLQRAEAQRLLQHRDDGGCDDVEPPIPSYDAVIRETRHHRDQGQDENV
ncbi:Rsp5p-dependent ubiquitination, sorting of cargo proteins at the multivesicular body [Ascosphaera aggregata]|nr:Rsp5p-dependent ubiquitination, sorting of cargo proteins at the multivesicular body [Ascosphaera aggregata]